MWEGVSAIRDVTAKKMVSFYIIPIGMVLWKNHAQQNFLWGWGDFSSPIPLSRGPFLKNLVAQMQHNRLYYCGIEKTVTFDNRGHLYNNDENVAQDFNPLSAKFIKWSNTLCRRIV